VVRRGLTPDEPVDQASAVVLDTRALFWLLQGSDRLGLVARALIEAAAIGGGALVAAISAWEIAMLIAKGRLALDRDVAEWLDAALALPGLRLAPLDPAVSVDSTRLPGEPHGDPADRMIVATARRHTATLITDDAQLLAYSAAGHVRAHRAAA
jgi:PIN domain nuclease of toxin-antitoxin system